MTSLLICGSFTLDNVRTADGTLLPQSCGGNVVYAALAASLWSRDPVRLVSRVGQDYPTAFLHELRERGLDLGGVARVAAPHGLNVAFAYHADGSRSRILPPEIMATIPASERRRFTDHTTLPPLARAANWQKFSPEGRDIPADWRVSAQGAHLAAMPVQRQASLAASLHGRMHVQLDSPWYDALDLAADHHAALLRDIDLLLPSEADLLAWRPDEGPIATAASLARQGRIFVLVKRGADGCVLIDPDGRSILAIPALPVDAVDPTGAGDSFCGGFLASYVQHHDHARAAIAGTVAASFAVEAPGMAGLLRASRVEAARRARLLQSVSTT